jgi:hypothetical protein
MKQSWLRCSVTETLVIFALLPLGLLVTRSKGWMSCPHGSQLDPRISEAPTPGVSDPGMFRGGGFPGTTDEAMLVTPPDFANPETTITRLVGWLKAQELTVVHQLSRCREQLGPGRNQ